MWDPSRIALKNCYAHCSAFNLCPNKCNKCQWFQKDKNLWMTYVVRLVVSSPNASQIFWCLKNYGRSRLLRKVLFRNQCCQLLTTYLIPKHFKHENRFIVLINVCHFHHLHHHTFLSIYAIYSKLTYQTHFDII